MQSRNQIVLFALFWVFIGSLIMAVVPSERFSLRNDKPEGSEFKEEHALRGDISPAIRSLTASTPPVVRIQQPTRVVGELSGNDVFVVTAEMLTVRSKPDRYSPRVRFLTRGDRVVKLEQMGRWYKIGRNEYISSTYLQPLRTIAH